MEPALRRLVHKFDVQLLLPHLKIVEIYRLAIHISLNPFYLLMVIHINELDKVRFSDVILDEAHHASHPFYPFLVLGVLKK